MLDKLTEVALLASLLAMSRYQAMKTTIGRAHRHAVSGHDPFDVYTGVDTYYRSRCRCSTFQRHFARPLSDEIGREQNFFRGVDLVILGNRR